MTERGRIIANFGAAVAVQLDSGELVQAVPLSKLDLLVAGDIVDVAQQRATKLYPRSTTLQRRDQRGRPHPLAANLTHLAIVSADPPGVDTLLIDQFCVAAESAGIAPIIIINKTDLYTDAQRADYETLLAVYAKLGYLTFALSREDTQQMQALQQSLEDKSVALVGASGVGKSSIVKTLLPDLDVRVGAISQATGLGSHTTSVTYWYSLSAAGSIIDSPGVRQFSVAQPDTTALRRGYVDIARAAQDCRFSNCSHLHEPNCAVKHATETHSIAQWRYDNYLKLSADQDD